MLGNVTGEDEHVLAFEIQGAGARVAVNQPDMLDRVARCVPKGSTVRPSAAGDRRFALLAEDGVYTVMQDGEAIMSSDTIEMALLFLSNHLMLFTLLRAEDVLFVHAGVVGHGEHAIVLPGGRGIGKTTLVAALLRAGAFYYTDDYMALAPDGRVHPYALPLLMRDPETTLATAHTAEDLGASVGDRALPVGIIAHIPHRDGAQLRLESQSPGAGVLLLLANSFGPDLRPGYAMSAAREAVSGALVLGGERGDADEAASALLELSAQL